MSTQPFVIVLGLAWSTAAFAHHDTAVQQVGSTASGDVAGLVLDDGPRFEARAGFAWQSYGVLRQGTESYQDADPAVSVERYTVAAAVQLAGGSRIDVALPAGRVRGADAGALGLGDLTASFTQSVGVFRLGALATAPTGRYTVDPVASVVDVQPDETGNLDLVTYDARASLGAGAWRAGLVAGMFGEVGRVVGDVRTTYTHTIGRTPDDIHWGSDVTAMATLSVRTLADRLTFGAGLLGQIHTADRVEGEPEPGRDDPVTLRTSRRRSLGVVGTLGARIASGFACGARARVPVTQWVQGVQLAESFTVSGQCTVARPFGRGRRRATADGSTKPTDTGTEG